MKKISVANRVLQAAALAALSLLLGACGKDVEDSSATAPAPATQASKQDAAPLVADEDKYRANAVVTGKTAAAVDLKFDVPERPQPGQAIEIELLFLPRAAADVLEVEVTGIPGLTVVSGNSARFEDVSSGDRHVLRALASVDAPGLYYVGVVARMVSKVQTDVRTFSVPVAVGSVAAEQKTAPTEDADGQAIESMPAVESGEPRDPASR